MSLNNPQDSVCDYLAELLYDVDVTEKNHAGTHSRAEVEREEPRPTQTSERLEQDLQSSATPSKKVIQPLHPAKSGPEQTRHIVAETVESEPVLPESVKTEPAVTEPFTGRPEPVKTEFLQPESAIQASPKSEAVKHESVRVKSAPIAPAKPVSVKPEPVKSEAVEPQTAKPVSVNPEPAKPAAAEPQAEKPVSVKPEAFRSELVKPEPINPEPATQETIGPSPAAANLQQPEDFDREKLNRLLSTAQFARAGLPAGSAKQPELRAKAEPVQVPLAVPSKELVSGEYEPVEAEPTISPHEDAALQWCDNGRPQWAQDRFDVLLFKVYGLTLAVPLIALGQIQPIDDQLTPLFGQADWFMGIQPTPMGKIKTVNTALFVMPERYNEAFLETAKYVISIHGVPWGLAVDSVEQPKTLSPEDVKWRTGRTQRPWLAGTVKEFMCALIDIPNMAELLNASDKNSRKARV